MATNQSSQAGQAGQAKRPARQQGVMGTPGGIVGNRPEALNLLLAVVGQARGMDVAARATTRPLETDGAPGTPAAIPEVIEVRRARVTDLRNPRGHPGAQDGQDGQDAQDGPDIADTFLIVCCGEPTMLCTFAEARDTLSRLPLLRDVRWTLIDLAKAPQVYDGR